MYIYIYIHYTYVYLYIRYLILYKIYTLQSTAATARLGGPRWSLLAALGRLTGLMIILIILILTQTMIMISN